MQKSYQNHYISMKHENIGEACFHSPWTSPSKKLAENPVTLEKWIIKPLGDGICVEGHRRLPAIHLFMVLLRTD